MAMAKEDVAIEVTADGKISVTGWPSEPVSPNELVDFLREIHNKVKGIKKKENGPGS